MAIIKSFTVVICLACCLTSCGTFVDGTSNSNLPFGSYTKQKVNHKNAYSYYRIKFGDTLYSISWRHGQHYETLAQYNSLTPPYTIYPGQYLIVPRNEIFAKPVVMARGKLKQQNELKTKAKLSIYSKPAAQAWLWPVEGELVRKFAGDAHKGVKIRAKPGERVRAAAAGKVVYSGNGIKSYGNLLIIKHDKRHLSAYGFNKKLLVRDGDVVKRGQSIAILGKDAILHFEIRNNGDPVDPLRVLPKR